MNVRLVAYRPATTSTTKTTAYNLDLQEEPNVALNYQFSDIKEPQTRKASYSQTFKLPFTDNNNEFFQQWFNVNLETLVFSTRTKFEAVLYVGTTPQFEGYLQLKSVYEKAQIYEVVLMSTSASLFSTIGNKRLKDVFREDDGSYSAELNHVFNATNFEASWDGTTDGFDNVAGTSLRDTSVNVQKVMYPFSVTRQNFYYNPFEATYLQMSQAYANNLVSNDGLQSAYDKSVSLSQFRPSIQILLLFKKVLAKAGYSYTSDFLDSDYFGKIFMTTCNHIEIPTMPTVHSSSAPSGYMIVANVEEWGNLTSQLSPSCNTVSDVVVPANTTSPSGSCTEPTDPDSVWNSDYNYFTKNDSTMSEINISHQFYSKGVLGCNSNSDIELTCFLREFDTSTNTPTDYVIPGSTQTVMINTFNDPDNFDTPSALECVDWTLSLANMPPGSSAQIVINSGALVESGVDQHFVLGNGDCGLCGNYHNQISMNWSGFANDIYGATIDVPACIDPDITQADFLRDIIQRFNLVFVINPDDGTNLLIEPYNDFIASGVIRDWTNKLDISKERVVKDTTEIQKKYIEFTDLEDEDLYNKSIKERYPDVNVFGHIKIDQFNNEFATGELTNHSIFSPYINGEIATMPTVPNSWLPNVLVQYEYTYEELSLNVVENKTTRTKPKLFWYNGSPSEIQNPYGYNVNIYMHSFEAGSATGITAHAFSTYPVCTPFDIIPGDGTNPDHQYTLTSANKSLHWNATPPINGQSLMFNYTGNYGNWFNNTLYGLYWKPYLDNIYSSEARLMECYLNLNEIDIFQLSFADEIFIKDTYWNILKIHNYQVGAQSSTKVTLIKSLNTKENCAGCDYVTGYIGDTNVIQGYYIWCPDDQPDCTPETAVTQLGFYTQPECCTCNGGEILWNADNYASDNLYPCIANAGSLPINLKSIFSNVALFSRGRLKNILHNKMSGLNTPLVTGTDNGKYSQAILPYYGDDMVIKTTNRNAQIPQYNGESHKIVMSGYTVGNTRGYAYPQGDNNGDKIYFPTNVNVAIKITGTASVVGGTNSTYTLGSTEAFGYHTGFVVLPTRITQLGAGGGVEDFSIREGANPTTCTLNIGTTSGGELQIGLDDSQTDTKRAWNITVELEIHKIPSLSAGFEQDYALFQDSNRIQFQDYDYLLWN